MNKKMSARGGSASGGKKIKLIPIILVSACFILAVPVSQAVTNPNYGTTTFFSQKTEKPADNPPVYDVGLRSGNENNGKDNGKDNNGNADNPTGSLFGQIITGVGSLFGNDTPATDNKSLFDWQKSSSQDSGGDSSVDPNSEFIMGSRGESAENMSVGDMEDYNNRISQKFAFKDNGAQAAPKKSKLLFTNVVIPVDMTTQYVIIILAVIVAIGTVVWYYLWKKEKAGAGKKSSEENYD
jgi:flagellar basal body-associated protein FliL